MLKVVLKKKIDSSYPIIIEEGILTRIPKLLASRHPGAHVIIIADSVTSRLFGKRLSAGLRAHKFRVLLLSVPQGERSKTRAYKASLEEKMLKAGCDRKSVIVAVGGGVVGDLAGFVAATYMRGITYVQVPTTLLAMVDSSIGGKTAINTERGKNLIGAFHQPEAVYIDPGCLSTLSARHIANGLAEAAKVFITRDKKSFLFLEKNLEKALQKKVDVLKHIINRAVRIKARIVEEDEREKGVRAILNFGHTIGHAIEKLSGYRMLHGEAVVLGMLVESGIARRHGILSEDDYKRITALSLRLGMRPVTLGRWNARSILMATKGDKKSSGGLTRYVLLKKIGIPDVRGGVYTHVVPDKDVIAELRNAVLLAK